MWTGLDQSFTAYLLIYFFYSLINRGAMPPCAPPPLSYTSGHQHKRETITNTWWQHLIYNLPILLTMLRVHCQWISETSLSSFNSSLWRRVGSHSVANTKTSYISLNFAEVTFVLNSQFFFKCSQVPIIHMVPSGRELAQCDKRVAMLQQYHVA